jgi:hypothetical protein
VLGRERMDCQNGLPSSPISLLAGPVLLRSGC